MAGNSDCIMSFSMWQKLIATITPNTVVWAAVVADWAVRLAVMGSCRIA